jgi:hypothetical protein
MYLTKPGIQLLVTALGYDEECKYLNLRLRMEQQRLYAWSETSGLLDLDEKNQDRILNSDVFNMHRQVVLDLLVQIKCLFDEFTAYQKKHKNLATVEDQEGVVGAPEKDAKQANFPMTEKKKNFLRKAMASLVAKSSDTMVRLKWSSFDKDGFESLLAKFSALNDNMTNILDHSLQVEIRHTVNDTNRGVLLLHHKIADLSHLVLALKSQLETRALPMPSSRISRLESEATVDALRQLSRLAKFKAFNETIDPRTTSQTPIDEAAAKFLELSHPEQQRNLRVPRYMIELDEEAEASESIRCEALLKTPEGKKKVWVEWKDYDTAGQQPESLTKDDIVDRVRKLAALLNHSPKPEAFCTPHCLGFFDKADPEVPADDVDILDKRLGLIFERSIDSTLHDGMPPVSLRELLQDEAVRRPRVTERIKIAQSLSNCLLYLHAVNWLHKGLRSHNVLFWRKVDGQVDYGRPILSGFDFSRPGGSDEMTEVPAEDAEHDLYRHPLTQLNRRRDRERSKKSFDIYSLGVIFAELAQWATVEGILGIDLRRARGKPDVARRVRERLLEKSQLEDIGGSMGERFESATRRCLSGGSELGLGEGDPRPGARRRRR